MTYLKRHLQVLFSTLGNVLRTPIASLSTVLIIAITLLLPCSFYIVIKSAQQLNDNWQGRPQISIFLDPELPQDDSQLIYQEIKLHPKIALAEFISPQQALNEFKALSGLDEELAFLDSNPLPSSIVVMPNNQSMNQNSLSELQQELSKIEGIREIHFDLSWVDRFNAILATMTRGAQLLSGLLAIGLILIVGNTIRLIILNRRDEIEITKLVGGTNAFIRRPFLYYGALLGVFGALTSLLLLYVSALSLKESVSNLSELYGGIALLHQLTLLEILIIILLGGILGWTAARLSVAQHLHAIEPK